MRAAALVAILAILITLAAGAQCITACAQPAPPPCHHTPQKGVKACDTALAFEDRAPLPALALALAILPKAPEPAASALAPVRLPLLRPPGDSAPLVLRI